MTNKESGKKYVNKRKFPSHPHVGVGVLLIRDQQLLLVKRKFEPDARFWSIPGGHLELGEKVEHAAEREAFEETGIKVKTEKLAGVINKVMYDENDKIVFHYVLINYFVKQIEGDMNQPPIADDDALEAKFVPFSELQNYKLTKSLVKLLKQLKIGY